MRISDWSSDVCSSDLLLVPDIGLAHCGRGNPRRYRCPAQRSCDLFLAACRRRSSVPAGGRRAALRLSQWHLARDRLWQGRRSRLEEQTSELQSLMRISYAVFCLKKKKTQKTKKKQFYNTYDR